MIWKDWTSYLKFSTNSAPGKGIETGHHWATSWARNAVKIQLGHQWKNIGIANFQAGETNLGGSYDVNDKVQIGAMVDAKGATFPDKALDFTMGASYKLCSAAWLKMKMTSNKDIAVHFKGKLNVKDMNVEVQKTVETNLSDPTNFQWGLKLGF